VREKKGEVMAKPVDVGELNFSSQKNAYEYFQKMLLRYHDGETINEADSMHLHNLIKRHPERLAKIGCGISRFYKDTAAHGTRCFWIERTDETKIAFSIDSCTGKRSRSE
jgi:hypothetical protein